MSQLRKLLLSVALLLAAPTAFAQDRTGFDVHAGVGSSHIRDEDNSSTFNGDAFGYYLGAEYRFTRHFALGVDVFDLGTAEDTVDDVETEIEVEGVDVFTRLVLPVNDTVEFYVRGGAMLYYPTVRPGFAATVFGDDAVSLGAGVDIGRSNLTLRLEGRYFNGTDDETGALLTAGVGYRF